MTKMKGGINAGPTDVLGRQNPARRGLNHMINALIK
jgi:hypothetical protein